MKKKDLFKGLLTAFVALILSSVVFADGPVYVTGAEYTIEGDKLTVSSGDGQLVLQTPNSLSHVWVMDVASLKLATEEAPFGNNVVLHVFGTLDVNGKSFSALRLDNKTESTAPERTTYGRIVNTSETASTIRLTSVSVYGNPYFGTFEERPGKISIDSSNLFFVMRSPTVDSPASEFKFSERTVFSVVDRPTKVKFVFYPPTDETKPIRLAEIGLTDHGAPVRNKSITASSSESEDHNASKLVDTSSSSYWCAEGTGAQTVEIEVYGTSTIDGYRITPYDGAPASAKTTDPSYRPSGWDVYVWRDSYFRYVLVDSKHDFDGWYPYNGTTSTTNMPFASAGLLGNPFGENVSITLNNTASNYAARLSGNETIKVGKFTSKGEVVIADGSTFAPGDISDSTGAFTANGTTAQSMARLELSSRGGAEQVLSITNAQNLAVVNGGGETVSVLLDDARAGEHLFGKLSDGENGQLGLVKRGSGERVIETEDSSYTGATEVHGGTLTVARKRASVTARYIRITPLATSGSDATYPWAMHEFQLLDANGNAVAWPSGAVATKPSNTQSHADNKLVDGDITTRFLMGKYKDGTSGYPPAVIDAKEPVTFSSYKWWSSHRHASDVTLRLPTSWKIEVSDVGTDGSWTVVAVDSYSITQEDSDDCAETTKRLSNENWQSKSSSSEDLSGLPRGPFYLNGAAQSAGTGLYTLDNVELFSSGTSRDTHRKLKAQYFRFRVLETVAPYAGSDSWGWQLTEIGLMKDGKRVDWPAETTGTMLGSSTHVTGMHTNLFDNVIWQNDNGNVLTANRCFVRTLPSAVVINAHEPLEFDAYSLTTTGPSVSQGTRMPKTWFLEASLDGSNYTRIDVVSGYEPVGDVLTKPYQEMGPFPVAEKWPLLDMGAGDSLGDASPVAISNNATLKLATDYEKFGPLSGAGALDLVLNAVGEINACAPATFSGSVTGEGTLAVCGDSVQTFDGASLSGVKTLELNGGAIAGTASFGGNDVTVAFNGGATGAALSGIGTLTVTGDVKYALPDLAGQNAYSVTLFTATDIPTESKALLEAGELVGTASHAWLCNITVTETEVTLEARKRGLLLLIK